MVNEKLTDNFKFWVDHNVIYCKIFNDFDGVSDVEDVDNIFLNAIFRLSRDVHMPILFNLEELNSATSIKVFRYLSKSRLLKSLALSKTFLVNSYKLKLLLDLHSFMCNPSIPDLIFKDFNAAIKYCKNDNRAYNSLN
ncbi:hypothetical protein [Olleya sp. HaHaR_3_96]|uniref:hypothetical protein n=1 Tax=Olleya sp. HaHaR_3_96 TaxID=2745560 RepID=UPI001C501F15|nr:hypothetical protein [Olleya sp. HaHaR_3_96]QXP59360.1 hypothetical protein H0I26_15760 [Olleya sp. HaHaR_3_96]